MKKQKIVCLWMLALALIFTLVFTACEHDGGIPGPGPSPGPGPGPSPVPGPSTLTGTQWTAQLAAEPIPINWNLTFANAPDFVTVIWEIYATGYERRQGKYTVDSKDGKKGSFTTDIGINGTFDASDADPENWTINANGSAMEPGTYNPD
jgi:hypothetical protein